jgi:hypothetical protein
LEIEEKILYQIARGGGRIHRKNVADLWKQAATAP